MTHAAPPATPGKIFCTGAPARYASYASLGVWQPGMITMLLSAHQVTTCLGLGLGLGLGLCLAFRVG